MISSSKSKLIELSSLLKKSVIQWLKLFDSARDAWFETEDAKLEIPIIFTPFLITTSSAKDPSTLPPDSTAISKITLPGFIFSMVAVSINFGAGLPNNCAVVITMSDLAQTSACRFFWQIVKKICNPMVKIIW